MSESNFNEKCENDFRKIISSFFKLLKKNKSQNGGIGFSSTLNKNGYFTGRLSNLNNYNSQKSTKKGLLPELNNEELPNIKKKQQKQISKERMVYECQIYEYLQKKSPKFINESTCFVRCLEDSFFLRNCGITFEELILENQNNISLFIFILEKLLLKIYHLHILGVAHNNLDCSHVLVGKREMINTRNMNKNKLKAISGEAFLNMPFIRKNIDIRIINFSKATILEPGQKIDVNFLTDIFHYYYNYCIQTLSSKH